MSDTLHGYIEGSEGAFRALIHKATDPVVEYYNRAFIRVTDDEITVIANQTTDSVVTYATVNDGFFDDFGPGKDQGEARAIIDVEKFMGYFDISTSGDSRVSVEFRGEPDDELATTAHIDGELETDLYLPSSDSDYENISLGTVERFNADNEFLLAEGETLPTEIKCHVGEIQHVMDVKSFDELDLDTFPIAVEDEELVLDAEDERGRNKVQGGLKAESVEGPDVSNHYQKGFEQTFNALSGTVDISTGPDLPLCVVKEDSGVTFRYLLAPASGD